MGNAAPTPPSAFLVELPHQPQDSGTYHRVPPSSKVSVPVEDACLIHPVEDTLAAAGAVFSSDWELLEVVPGSPADRSGLLQYHRRVLSAHPVPSQGYVHLSFQPIPWQLNDQPVWCLSQHQLIYSTIGKRWMITDRGTASTLDNRGHTMSGYHSEGTMSPDAPQLAWTVFSDAQRLWREAPDVRVEAAPEERTDGRVASQRIGERAAAGMQNGKRGDASGQQNEKGGDVEGQADAISPKRALLLQLRPKAPFASLGPARHSPSPPSSPATAGPARLDTPPLPEPCLEADGIVRFRARDVPDDMLELREGRLDDADGRGIVVRVDGTQWAAQVSSMKYSQTANCISFPQVEALHLPSSEGLGRIAGGLRRLCRECRTVCSIPGNGEHGLSGEPVCFMPRGDSEAVTFRRRSGCLSVDVENGAWIDKIEALEIKADWVSFLHHERILLPARGTASVCRALFRLCKRAGVPWELEAGEDAEALHITAAGNAALTGVYVIANDAVNDRPVWERSGGGGWLYCGGNDRWFLTSARSDIALCAGDYCTASAHRGWGPEFVIDWQSWDADSRLWVLDEGLTICEAELSEEAEAVVRDLRIALLTRQEAGEHPHKSALRWAASLTQP
eukprot:TRINITY_DN21187_c0_g1_i1.p1 TRINITY_DN21187_c0_g1~~TRINITY_DN21187_c0_g1_i1.p1  ORF type:complete len:620 (+),score=122.01 TRINITY_DN21187_c0_g1_i1:54-1913(+)